MGFVHQKIDRRTTGQCSKVTLGMDPGDPICRLLVFDGGLSHQPPKDKEWERVTTGFSERNKAAITWR